MKIFRVRVGVENLIAVLPAFVRGGITIIAGQ